MKEKIKSLTLCQTIGTIFLIPVFIIAPFGCGTSYLKNYQSALHSTDAPKYRVVEWKIEHNLFNNTYPTMDQEELKDDLALALPAEPETMQPQTSRD